MCRTTAARWGSGSQSHIPSDVHALVIQNAVAHEDGLGPLWEKRREFWADRVSHEAALRENFFSFAATRQRHVGHQPERRRATIPTCGRTSSRSSAGRASRISRRDLFYDYRTNVASYTAWQDWLRQHQPPLLVLWGRYDPSFQVEEAEAYRREVPDAEVHILDAGHFALDEQPDAIANLTRGFLGRLTRE